MNVEQRQQLEHAEEAVRHIAEARNHLHQAFTKLRVAGLSIFVIGNDWQKAYQRIDYLDGIAAETVRVLSEKYGVTK